MDEVDIETYKKNIIKIRKYTEDMSMLMAEDYEPLHDTLKKMFKSLFKSVDSAFDGKEAFEMYKNKINSKEKYSIIFTDIEMPNMSGVELVKAIREVSTNDNIIVFSAHQESKYLLELINLGVRRFILKPAPLATLLEELILICDDIFNDDSDNIITLSKNIIYNKEQKSMYLDEKPIILTKYEQYIIELLIEKVNLAVSNDEVVEHLYLNMIDMNIDNVRKLMYKLRQKLPEDFIQSIHGIGYRIVISSSDN